ncbi:MAG: hypothetical protein A3H72_01730 [Candidatus Doudnabacteria bacterium RIFCSPLOWO2_02_FULL_48_8]|uniref:DUF4446 domain-containing protein n=1 Tax=Candidatus Doudnabacteria bacterium RIFCSPHIGHO2_01_FULL_46_24 TaxID=1817825 RepID=A0A1F5NW61_9BACT|nr:MAG: hypothetical protein A2720_00305 [Candidatus Doudnabacteria bacterium RIFCSPHIGHO2_01_FULL_46_24]OGE94961.1 MAG: hypothetical protein A3H72_01730 [Candidatus Doudnabacteria bacterium RIFCSPLOWO2_02_FULL_48_8]OGE96169.1 MAG: hypothetical protein A3E98_04340 [Candidatus Doudnabacteria bacterium RIFCSPHIGHO2_12_FULL_48_11]
MNQQLLIANLGLTFLALLGLGFTWLKLNRLDKIRKEFFSAGIEKNLEEVLVDQNRKITILTQELARINDELTDLTILNKNDIKKIGFIRFNPFNDAGGNMSFALALLNEHDDGVVISSLHGREGTRIYAKEVKAATSKSKLTEEEVQAIKQAK